MTDLIIRILADGLVVPVVLLGAWALVWRVPRGQRYRVYCRVLMAGLTAFLAAKLIGAVYQPEALRPFQLMGEAAGASFLDNPGFPSDHVLFCAAIALAVLFETRARQLGYALLGLTLLVGVGRVLALVHTPLDVLGGLVIACAGIPWYLTKDKAYAKLISTEARKKRQKRVK